MGSATINRNLLNPAKNRGVFSCARMKLSVQGLEPVPIDVGVNLRRADARMAEQFLNGAQIRAAGKQMSGKAVAKRVRADIIVQTRPTHILLDQNPEHLARQPSAAAADKDPADRRIVR